MKNLYTSIYPNNIHPPSLDGSRMHRSALLDMSESNIGSVGFDGDAFNTYGARIDADTAAPSTTLGVQMVRVLTFMPYVRIVTIADY